MQNKVLDNVKKNRATSITTYCPTIYMVDLKNKDAKSLDSRCRRSAECCKYCSYNIADNL